MRNGPISLLVVVIYKDSTRPKGKEIILQLLKYCKEDLRGDFIRSAGDSLTNKTEEGVIFTYKNSLFKKRTQWLLV